jgi:hypothetical protein
LQTELGQRLLEVLILATPPPRTAPNQSADNQLGVIRGYEVCLQTMVGLASVEVADDLMKRKSALQQADDELNGNS